MLYAKKSSPNTSFMRRIDRQQTGSQATASVMSRTGTSSPLNVNKRSTMAQRKGVFVVDKSEVDGDDIIA